MASTKISSSDLMLELLRVISKPTFKREDREVKFVLPWLCKRSKLLQNLDKGVLLDVVKNCTLLSSFQDDVVIKQGERGDSFYVILRGTASVYIDPRMTGEGGGNDDGTARSSARKKVKKHPKAPESEASVLSGMEASNVDGTETVDGLSRAGTNVTANTGTMETDDVDGAPMKKRPTKLLASLDRNKFGKLIVSYGPGSAFGEIALVNNDTVRNATVITNEDTDLMVIDQDLFDRSLRAEQEARYVEIREFIEEHPFFSPMSPKFKKLLEMSIRKEKYIFDTYIMRQGDPVVGLHFIINGSANISIQPKKHQAQYPHLWPFEAGKDQIAIEFEHLREARREAILRKYEDPSVWETKPEDLIIRREQGYAAIEKRMKENHINICSVQTKEVLGDVETLINLSTYMQTVRCTSDTTCFVLDTKNFERLISNKKNTSPTMDIMREYVKNKLHTRMQMRQADLIPFLGYLHQKLTEQMLPQAKKVEPFKTSKALPDVDEEMQHLMQYFKDGKEVVLIKPSIPGVVYYKELMREKAKVREQQRRASKPGENITLSSVYKTRRKQQPRSMLQIRESLKQMMEAEVIEMETKKFRKRKFKPKKEPPVEPQFSERSERSQPPMPSPKTLIGMSNSKPKEPVKNDLMSLMKAAADKKEAEAAGTVSAKQSPRVSNDSVASKLASNPNLPKSVPPVFITEMSKSEIKLPAIREEKTQEDIVLKGGAEPTAPKPHVKKGNGTNRSQNTPVDVPDAIIIDPSTRRKRTENSLTPDTLDEALTATANANINKTNNEITNNKANVPTLPTLGGSQNSLNQGQDSQATDDTDVSDNWRTAITFVNQRVQDRLTRSLLDEETSYKDFETSEPSLKLLENRIRAFHIKYGMGQKTKNLPPLKRYKLDSGDSTVHERPKPGGKVWVNTSKCKFRDCEYVVKDHKHVRYNMVDALPEFNSVQKSRVVVQQLLKTADFTAGVE